MPGETRAVIDTNVIISAFINPDGPPAGILKAVREGRFVMVTSHAINREVLGVMERPKLRERYNFAREFAAISEVLWERAEIVVEPPPVAASRDPSDDKFLAAAVGGKASYIVTGDIKDLLSMGEFGESASSTRGPSWESSEDA